MQCRLHTHTHGSHASTSIKSQVHILHICACNCNNTHISLVQHMILINKLEIQRHKDALVYAVLNDSRRLSSVTRCRFALRYCVRVCLYIILAKWISAIFTLDTFLLQMKKCCHICTQQEINCFLSTHTHTHKY